jgi:hypothetical protein
MKINVTQKILTEANLTYFHLNERYFVLQMCVFLRGCACVWRGRADTDCYAIFNFNPARGLNNGIFPCCNLCKKFFCLSQQTLVNFFDRGYQISKPCVTPKIKAVP